MGLLSIFKRTSDPAAAPPVVDAGDAVQQARTRARRRLISGRDGDRYVADVTGDRSLSGSSGSVRDQLRPIEAAELDFVKLARRRPEPAEGSPVPEPAEAPEPGEGPRADLVADSLPITPHVPAGRRVYRAWIWN